MHRNNKMTRVILCTLFVLLLLALSASLPGNDRGIQLVQESSEIELSLSAGESSEGEQERIDTIVRAFNRLPAPELERLGVDIKTAPIQQGTSQAMQLKRAWLERQKELKEAMASMTKPAEHMGELARRMKVFAERRRQPSSLPLEVNGKDDVDVDSIKDISNALEELETTLADIDNARDFYTIGGWPVLVSMLSKEQHPDHRTRAAWAIGTAIKNSYDYQLWVLEVSKSHPTGSGDRGSDGSSCLQMLVEMLDLTYQNSEEMQRRALYALSSAMRGNADVQEALLLHDNKASSSSLFLSQLTHMASKNFTSQEIPRKIWSLVSDMLQEAAYVRGELAAELARLPDNSIMKMQAESLHMMGDYMCSTTWANLASTTLRRLGANALSAAPLRATLVSVLQTAAEIFEQCPEELIVVGKIADVKGINILAVINDQVQKLLINYSSLSANPASPQRKEEAPEMVEGEVSLSEEFDFEDELDERLVTTFSEEIVGLSKRIIAAKLKAM